ncbi:MAG TPA: T9SS type A sorting domain-containing protein [Saprospiraceae bacterium]|nr:T9SS type A sorting domain-containing protein [Saprospiraceae bacterium]
MYKDGLTSNVDEVIDGQSFMFNNNSFLLTEINPDGSELRLFSSYYRNASLNSAYGGDFDAEGNFIGNWFPIEHVTESSGFGGIKKYFRGSAKKPQALAGITGYGNFDYYQLNPTSYGIFKGEYAAEPSVTNDGRILFSKTADPFQDYGIWIMDADGSSQQLIFDHPGTTELHARFIEPRNIPPLIADRYRQHASSLPPTGPSDLRKDGSFQFDCRNIFYNTPVDDGIIAAPAIGDAHSVRFFANPLLNEQYGSLEMLNFPMLYNEIGVDAYGRVLEPDAPANIPLFEQARSAPERGYTIPRTGGGIMDGAAHVTGFNYGRPGQKVSCVGCHAGHSMVAVPDDPETLFFSNVAPGAKVKASSGMSPAGHVIDKKNRTASNHWFTPEGIDPKGQWLRLQWRIPFHARKIVLHNIPDTNRAQVLSCKLQLYRDTLFQNLIREIQIDSPLSPDGTELDLSDVPFMQALRLEFLECKGGIYHWNAATIGEIEVIGSVVDPARFKEVCDCKGKAYGSFRVDSCGQCLLPEDPKFNDCLTSTINPPTKFRADLYPVPAQDVLYLNLDASVPQPFILRITSSDGKPVFTPHVMKNNTWTIPVSHLPNGLYFIQLQCGNLQKVLRFVKF